MTDNTFQARWHPIEDWPEEYLKALGSFIIACSSWEYAYELLCKDLGLAAGEGFHEKMRNADKAAKDVEVLKKKIAEKTQQPVTQKIIGIIDTLENSYKDERHDLIHGWHHIHDNKTKITRVNKDIETIQKSYTHEKLAQDAQHIHELSIQLNGLRKEHIMPKPAAPVAGVQLLVKDYEPHQLYASDLSTASSVNLDRMLKSGE